MRPPEFTGGNRPTRLADALEYGHFDGFNEAAGIHRRKPSCIPSVYRDHRTQLTLQ